MSDPVDQTRNASPTASANASLIDALVAAHRPVRRIAQLRVRIAVVLGVWSMAGLGLAFGNVGFSAFASRLSSHWSFGFLVAALLTAGVAGSVAAIAASEPGREGVERFARRLGLAAFGAAACVGLVAAASNAGVSLAPTAGDAGCFGVALTVALVPGIALFFLLRRGFVQRPLRTAALGLLGAVALGGLTIHVVCPMLDVTHAFFGHVLPPALAMLAAAMPLALLLGADEPIDSLD